MIKGKRKTELSAEEILKRISNFDIYKHYIRDFKINEVMCNPFRDDKHPSFIIGNRYGELLHSDFADSKFRGNAIQLVQQIHDCGYDEALKVIDKEFSLGILSGELGTEYKKITSQYKQPEEAGKRYSLIQVVTRKFTEPELEYWKSYYQTIDDLRANNIYSIKEVFLNKKKYSIPDDELRFGYFYPQGGWWKIYRCHADKKNKWISNVPLTTAYGLENLDRNYNTLVTKSLKDYLVCRKVYKNVCHVQNESISSFSPETIQHITMNSKEIFVGFDNDPSGKRASIDVTEAFGWKHINPPDRLLCNGNSDWSDWAKCEGLEKVREHFILKKLINE